MSDKTKLEQDLLMAKAIGAGLLAALTDMMVAHAKSIGASADEGLLAARQVADRSVFQLQVTGTSLEGMPSDAGPEVRRRLSIFLDQAEGSARRALGLMPASRAKN